MYTMSVVCLNNYAILEKIFLIFLMSKKMSLSRIPKYNNFVFYLLFDVLSIINFIQNEFI